MNWDKVIAELECDKFNAPATIKLLLKALRKGLESSDIPKIDDAHTVYVRQDQYWFPIGKMEYMDLIEGKQRLVFRATRPYDNDGVLIYKVRIAGLDLQFAGIVQKESFTLDNMQALKFDRFEVIPRVLNKS